MKGTQEIVFEIIKNHPNISVEMITFHAIGRILETQPIRKRTVSQAVYRLSKQGIVKSINKEKPSKWVIVKELEMLE